MNDQLLFKDLDDIEKFNVPYCLINNTLLSLYRDKKCFEEEERECVVLIPANYKTRLLHSKGTTIDMDSVSGLGNINREGKIAICFMTECRGKIVVNPFLDNFFVFDKSVIFPFSILTHNTRKIPIPHKPEDYLSQFYGDWKTPVPSSKWNWVNSRGIVKAQGIDEAVKLYLKYGKT